MSKMSVSVQESDGVFNVVKNSALRPRLLSSFLPLTRPPLVAGSQNISIITKPLIQTKLKIGAANDKYEQEADRVADQVMRMAEPANTNATGISGDNTTSNIQRMCAGCQQEPGDNILQTKAASGQAKEVTPNIARGIQFITGGGRPLPGASRNYFEPRFKRDFSNVKIYTDNRAAELADSIGARAFTLGNNIVFGAGQYTSETGESRRLMAHELTHVVQQGTRQIASSGMIQRMAAPSLSPENVEDVDYDPWSGSGRGRVAGTKFRAQTDGGSPVAAWIKTGGLDQAESLRYWCHGHSMGTYASYGYSVFSGSGAMGRVISDEYQNIYPDSTVTRGDLAVWLQPDIVDSPHLEGTAFGHSAIIESPIFNSSGQLNNSRTMLSSKNGALPLIRSVSLERLEQIYGPDIGYYRKR